jgi:methenyltetrahydromethanopterin cyclohydrolase
MRCGEIAHELLQFAQDLGIGVSALMIQGNIIFHCGVNCEQTVLVISGKLL